jgi:signal transduction histidine kinase
MGSEAVESTSGAGAPARRAGTPLRRAWRAADRWLHAGPAEGLLPSAARRLGVVWVAVSLPVITAAAAFVHTPGAYVFVLIFMACGAYTTPGLVAGLLAVRRAPARDRASYVTLYTGLVLVYAVGVAMLVGLATGWRWANPLGVPVVVLAGLAHMVGLTWLARSRSGRRALAVDVLESSAAVVAVLAPLVVAWGPAVVDADHAWYTIPAATTLVPHVWGAYWSTSLLVRLGPGRMAFERFAVLMALGGTLNAGLQVAQGVSGFTLAAPPLIGYAALCASMYLLIPLFIPQRLRPGLDRLPPQAQVRGGWLAPVVGLTGTAALLAATAAVAGDRPWAVPYALGVVTMLLVLAGLRQVAGAAETRRLYRQVEEASDERHHLLTQMLERSVHDRRRVARQLHDQALAAYASFSALAGTGRTAPGLAGVVAEASAAVRGDLARHADSLQGLLLAIRPLEGRGRPGEGLRTPIAAYLAGAYGDRRPPRLTVEVPEPLGLDWVTETVLLQVVQEALHNVWRHSHATSVAVTVARDGEVVAVHIADDGVGFDPAAVVEESGLAAMRASATVLGGTLALRSRPGGGTVVSAWLGPRPAGVTSAGAGAAAVPAVPGSARLRLVTGGLADGPGPDA